MILAPGTYCFSSVTLSGGSTLQVDDAVKICLDIKNSSDKSDFAADSSECRQYHEQGRKSAVFSISSSHEIKLRGGGQVYMAVHAPNSPITFWEGATFTGR